MFLNNRQVNKVHSVWKKVKVVLYLHCNCYTHTVIVIFLLYPDIIHICIHI